jgi:hypothetical protein
LHPLFYWRVLHYRGLAPWIRGATQKVNAMTRQNQPADAFEICDLEYDVASVGSTEPSASEENQAAFFLVYYRLPENG